MEDGRQRAEGQWAAFLPSAFCSQPRANSLQPTANRLLPMSFTPGLMGGTRGAAGMQYVTHRNRVFIAFAMKPIRTAPLLALALFFAACDASVDVSQSSSLTPAEAQMAAEVVGQSMSDQSEGMMSDMYDMDAGIDASGLAYFNGPLARGSGGFSLKLWRPSNRQDGRVRYDSTTGTHRVTYERKYDGNNYYRSVEADLAYVFTDAGGAFIRDPRRNRDRVSTIRFTGTREGETRYRRPGTSTQMRSAFKREAEWTLAGLTTTTATFKGDQTSSGSAGIVGVDSTQRTFNVRLIADDVTITKTRASQGFESSLTGTMRYEIVMRRGSEEKRATGTIDLTQNGKALMRFMGINKTYEIDLASGDADDDDDDDDD